MKLKHFFFFCITLIFVGCVNNANENQNKDENTDEDTITAEANNNEVIIDENITEKDSVEEDNKNITKKPVKVVSFRAYISDPDKVNPTNVRKTPSGDIILKLERNSDYIIYIVACQGRWFKVDKIEPTDSKIDIPGGAGWIHGSVIGFSTRNYGNQKLNLYEKANANSKVVEVLKYETELKLVDIEGEWVKVEWNNDGKKIIGWIEKEWLCGNPYTNCC